MAAEMLTLKVSEQQYRKTLEDLNGQMTKLQTVKANLGKYRERLTRAYQAPQAQDALRAVKEYEQRAQEAWEQVSKQREKILSYLENQNRVDSTVKSAYSGELQKASQRFGS